MVTQSQTILIIDGSQSELQELEGLVQSAGFQTITARRALEGLDIVRRRPVNMVLTAIDLPDMGGRELATTLRSDKRFGQIPIVALIDYDSAEQRELNLAAGITGFIKRPLDTNALPIYLQFYLSGGRDAADDMSRLDAARKKYLQDVVSGLEGRIRELEAKNEALERLDGMKDSFIQLTAHELRTPLTLVTGYIRLLEDYPEIRQAMKTDAEFRTLFEGLTGSMNRMQGIIEEILVISRIMTNKITLNISVIQPADIVKRVLYDYKQALKEREISVHFSEKEWPPTLHADGDLLYLTISNLVSNAIKYTPNRRSIYISASYNAQMLRFSVRDTGIGIDAEQQEKIFERMHIGGDVGLHGTSKTAFGGGGLGLGLAICRGIIEAHGGKIKVESSGHDPERLPGSEFIVLMPVQATATKTTAKLKRLVTRTLG